MALDNALPNWLREVKVTTVCQTLAQIKAKALLYTLADMLEELKVERLRDTFSGEEAKELVNTIAHRLGEVDNEKLGGHWPKLRLRCWSTHLLTGLVS